MRTCQNSASLPATPRSRGAESLDCLRWQGDAMTIASNPQWRAMQRESQLAAEQIVLGVTALGQANHPQPGLYSQAFSGLSIGIERAGKLIFVADHAIQNSGTFPADRQLRDIGHDINVLLPKCEEIGTRYDPARSFAARPVDSIHRGIEETLSSFATRLRYYNLSFLAGSATNQTDPIALW